MNDKTSFITFLILFCWTPSPAQNLSYLFNNDSLMGFDQPAAIRSAIDEQFLGKELKVRVFQLKRKFINDKYNLWPNVEQNNFENFQAKVAVAGCVNEDFEASPWGIITTSNQINGWVVTSGSHALVPGANSCDLLGCCPQPPLESELINAPNGYIDPIIGSCYPIYSVFGSTPNGTNAIAANPQITGGMFGSTFIRVNSSANNFGIEKLSKTLSVTASSAIFQFAYLAVMSAGHGCCDAGTFQIKILTGAANPTPIPCQSFYVSALSPQCVNTLQTITFFGGQNCQTVTVNNANIIFNKWQIRSIDLSQYMGQIITIEIISSDCTAGGHYGYSYFDAQCKSILDFNINGNVISTSNDTINFVSCTKTTTIIAPSGFDFYNWSSGQVFSNSPVITTSVAGMYTVNMINSANGQSCAPTFKVFKLQFADLTPQIFENTMCLGETKTIGVIGVGGYSWNTGATTSSIVVTPSVSGAYSYSVHYVDTNGCVINSNIHQNVDECVGLAEMRSVNTKITIFPNPSKGEFTLITTDKFKKGEIVITNNLGQIVFTQSISVGENKIKTKGLMPNTYEYLVLEKNKVLKKGKLLIE